MARILVTGATGFVGSVLCETLAGVGHTVRAALRSDRTIEGVVESVIVGEHDETTDWCQALEGVDHVVHAAARVHVMRDDAANTELYMRTNARGTQRLAQACSQAGVRQLVYLSSVKVNGEQTFERPFQASDAPHPQDAYGLSKLKAEQALMDIASTSQMRVIVVRPPLVYGPGVRANFRSMLSAIHAGVPLPLGAIANSRSLVSVWNLCDLLRRCLELPQLGSRVLMVSDGHDVSTPELVCLLARAMGRSARLLPIPAWMLKAAGGLIGKSGEVSRLVGSLQVDIAETRTRLNWEPPVSIEEGLARTAQWYCQSRRAHGT